MRQEVRWTDLTYEQIADDLAALLAELRIDKADVLGHSDGGIVALFVAMRRPAAVERRHLGGAGEFEHRSEYHQHEHNHAPLVHAHKGRDQGDESADHDKEAHIHDHGHPTG